MTTYSNINISTAYTQDGGPDLDIVSIPTSTPTSKHPFTYNIARHSPTQLKNTWEATSTFCTVVRHRIVLCRKIRPSKQSIQSDFQLVAQLHVLVVLTGIQGPLDLTPRYGQLGFKGRGR